MTVVVWRACKNGTPLSSPFAPGHRADWTREGDCKTPQSDYKRHISRTTMLETRAQVDARRQSAARKRRKERRAAKEKAQDQKRAPSAATSS